jgi:NADPH-dependent ferric siderophore reductase
MRVVAEQGHSRRVRKEPPEFRLVNVLESVQISSRMRRLTLGGSGLTGFRIDQPASSVRLLFPSDAGEDLVIPLWNGNEFSLPDGTRPLIRTLTPRRFDPAAKALDVEVVLHGGGAVEAWAKRAAPGDPAAVSGPGRGYEVDLQARSYFLAGDETALAAIGQLLEWLPEEARAEVHVEAASRSGRLALPDRPGSSVSWHFLPEGSEPGRELVELVERAEFGPKTRLWIAGEAASVQRMRGHLFGSLGLPRTAATVRGYWKHGRAAAGSEG